LKEGAFDSALVDVVKAWWGDAIVDQHRQGLLEWRLDLAGQFLGLVREGFRRGLGLRRLRRFNRLRRLNRRRRRRRLPLPRLLGAVAALEDVFL
jgi:hypothetical protein